MSETGDPVRAGRVVGKRRLGGWCDVYLDADARVLVRAGQTLIGAETMICRLVRDTMTVRAGTGQTVTEAPQTPDNPDNDKTDTETADFDEDLTAEEASAALMARLKLQADKEEGGD